MLWLSSQTPRSDCQGSDPNFATYQLYGLQQVTSLLCFLTYWNPIARTLATPWGQRGSPAECGLGAILAKVSGM